MTDRDHPPGPGGPAPERDSLDDVIAAYMRDVDRSLLRHNLTLTPEQRIEQLMSFLGSVEKLRAGRARP